MLRHLRPVLSAAALILLTTACGAKKIDAAQPAEMRHYVAQTHYPEAVVMHDAKDHGWNVTNHRFVREVAAVYDSCSAQAGRPCVLHYQNFEVSGPHIEEQLTDDRIMNSLYYQAYNHAGQLFSQKINDACEGDVLQRSMVLGTSLGGNTPVRFLAQQMGLGTRGGSMVIIMADDADLLRDFQTQE